MTRITSRSLRLIAFFVSLAGLLGALTNRIAIAQSNVSSSGGCTNDIECDDGLPCTLDFCDLPSGGPAGSGVCQHESVPDGQPGGVGTSGCAARFGLLCGGCDDGTFCNGAETCQGGACAPGTPPCTGGQVCSESFGLCQDQACTLSADCTNAAIVGASFAGIAALHCNGVETCIDGACVAGTNPCGYGAICAERRCSHPNQPNFSFIQSIFCLTNEDCAEIAASTCTVAGPACYEGRCCTGSTEPACDRRFKSMGRCAGGSNNGAACSSNSNCASNNCFYGQNCDTLGRSFYPGDAQWPYIPGGGGILCPVINDIPTKCPKYGSGIAPHGAEVQLVGPLSNSDIPNPLVGVPIKRLGDDYKFSNTGVCIGGFRDGLGCADDAACPGGGTCNLAATSVMSVYYVRLIGGSIPSYTRLAVEFLDAAGRFVAEAYPEMTSGSDLERLYLDPPLIVPSEGFVILRIASEYTPNGELVWTSTDAADVGSNDPDILWLNDGPVANFLAPNPGILAFEMEGEKVAAPLGACCDGDAIGCTNGVLPWVCEGDGNTFQGVGTTCPDPACDIGACCDAATGACTVVTPGDCSTAGGDFQGYGTDCDPDCCPQPAAAFGGADRCEEVDLHVITVPPIGQLSTITITGDNSLATLQPGETPCHGGAETPPVELGWYEGFEFTGCAMIRVDYCCADPVKRPAYPVLFNSCPCFITISSNENPYLFPQPDHDRGSPYCDDDNQWATFGPLSGGQYYIPIQSGVPGSFGQYQVHITAEACPKAACCVADQCTDGVNQLECDALGGTLLAPPQKVPAVADCSTSPCATGSCCPGPGECSDVRSGQPMTPSGCAEIQGTYHGGVRCQGGTCSATSVESCQINSDCPGSETCLGTFQQKTAPSPCPLCSIEGAFNCQAFDNAFSFTLSDRHVGHDGMLSADDFRPEGSILDHVCVWGFYLDLDINAVQPDCSFPVNQDHFRVRVFANDPATGRSPGTLVGSATATSQKGALPESTCEVRLLTQVFGFELELDSPITGLTPGATYWIEVSNDVSDSLATCTWFWNQRAQYTDSYSFNGSESGYPLLNATTLDNVFCLNMSFTPSVLGTLDGACCTCDGNCSLKTLWECENANGVWDITNTTCAGVTCPAGPPPNDNCVDGPPTITVGSHIVSNQCATTDGFGPLPSDWMALQIDFDLWYHFVAPEMCDLVVSECQTGLRFDSAFAVYSNCAEGPPFPGNSACTGVDSPRDCCTGVGTGTCVPCDPTICPPCPLNANTSAEHTAGVWQDESCTGFGIGGAGIWRASEQILRNALPGECFLIRVGSFPGHRGTAILDIQCENNVVCDPACIFFPYEETRFISMCGVINDCLSPATMVGAIRVHLTSLHHVNPPYTGGPSVPFTSFEGQVRWVGPPSQYVESTANPTGFWASRLQCTPHYQNWTGISDLFVTGSEIVPSSTYDYELLRMSCQGSEATCTDVSATFTVKTTRWADVEYPFNPPDASTQPNIADVAALVDKFENVPSAPIKVRALLAGVDQFGSVNLAADLDFSHIAVCVDAFQGQPYPYAIPACP